METEPSSCSLKAPYVLYLKFSNGWEYKPCLSKEEKCKGIILTISLASPQCKPQSRRKETQNLQVIKVDKFLKHKILLGR